MGTVWPVYEHKYCYDNFYFWHYVEEACAKNLFHRCPTFNVADESMTGHIDVTVSDLLKFEVRSGQVFRVVNKRLTPQNW